MNLFQSGIFTSSAGLSLPWKINCDLLTREDWATIAATIAGKISFSAVVSVHTGGDKFRDALLKYVSAESSTVLPVVIVDDVLTTGTSMERYRKLFPATAPVIGVVLFARGPCPRWIVPVFSLGERWV